MLKIKCENKELSDQVEKSDVLVVEKQITNGKPLFYKKVGKLVQIEKNIYNINYSDCSNIDIDGLACVKMSDKEYHIHNFNEDPVRCICSLT